MHKIKEMLMKELYEYEDKAKKTSGGKLSAGDLETLHKLTDTVKNIDKIEMLEDDGGYSEGGDWMGEGRIYGQTYRGGESYARGRGRNARRDSMGRYSREGGMTEEGGSYRGGSYEGSSYRRGGRGGRGGYSREGGYSMADGIDDMMEKAEEMLEEAETPEQKQAIHKFIKELERMK